MYRKFWKRFIDVIVALVVLLIFSPLLLLVYVILFFTNGGQPLFFQKRPGKNEKIFSIIKFRTMSNKRNRMGELLPDKDRLTAIGKFIRKTSLDELPQLINVLKGDMSLIGPRPLLIQYLPLYNKEQRKRHLVRPGITGWAQVNGRNAISWNEKFQYDTCYVEHLSFPLDMKILWLTIAKVFKSENVSQEGQATMEYFTGNSTI
jgi:undecaprenyl phosphate N,N'-diacetylbacillosamine 1-phosphate transferase